MDRPDTAVAPEGPSSQPPSFTVPWAYVEERRDAVLAGALVSQRTFRRAAETPGGPRPAFSVSVLDGPDPASELVVAALVGADTELFSSALPFVRDVRAADGSTHVGYWFDGRFLVVVHGTGVSASDMAALLGSIS